MALPNKIQHQAITGSSLPSTIDNDINAFKLAVLDIFGIPDNTNISTAVMAVNAAGLDSINFRNTAGNPGTAGFLQRNAALLKFHDGTAARTVLLAETAQTISGALTLTASPLNLTSGTDFTVGTTDAFSLIVKTSGSERARLTTGGTLLHGTTQATGSNSGDEVLVNNTARRWVDAAAATSANFGFLGNSSNDIEYAVPAASNLHIYTFAGTSRFQLKSENSGAGLLFVGESSADHAAPAANNAVIYTKDAGGLTQLLARFNSGSPVELAVEGGKPTGIQNPIINGNMEVWQRGTTFAAAANNQFGADRFAVERAGEMVFTINRSTDVPTVAQAGVLFNYSFEIDITTADASVTADQYTLIRHRIEGYNWRHFAQRQITISFWVRSTKTGTYSLGVRSAGGTINFYVTTYTISASDTWEFKTIIIPASPSTGSWDYTTGIGLALYWAVAGGTGGTNDTSTLNTWSTGNGLWSTTQVNGVDNTANFFRLTGVKMELGSVATPIQFRSFQDELALCKRYYQKSFLYATTPAQNVGANTGYTVAQSTATGATTALLPVYLPVQLRTSSISSTLYNPLAANAQIRNFTDSADFTSSTTTVNSEQSFIISGTGNAGLAVGEQYGVHWTADAEL